jgi:hypothetical protein
MVFKCAFVKPLAVKRSKKFEIRVRLYQLYRIYIKISNTIFQTGQNFA